MSKWARVAPWIGNGLIVFSAVAFLIMFALDRGSPKGEAIGKAAVIAFFAWLYWLPVAVLIAIVEGLRRWHSGRKTQA
jgi:hypothetical protein